MAYRDVKYKPAVLNAGGCRSLQLKQRVVYEKADRATRLLAAKPVCAICGPGDDKFPPWADDCDHTTEERRRVH